MAKNSRPTSEMKELARLIPEYAENNTIKLAIEKKVKAGNEAIKSIFSSVGINSYAAGGYVANMTATERVKFDEDALLSKIKELGVKGIVKKKEYVDEDALESAIYNGTINAADLASCQIISTTYALRIKKEENRDAE